MNHHLARNVSNRIGCHCWGTNPASVQILPTEAEVGCRWVRATRPMQMDVVSEGPRRYNFADHGEASIDLALAHGMSIMGILDARWGNETRFNDLPFASPIWEHLDLWEDFTTAAVNFYKDRVKYWEIINEPPFFWWYPTPEGVTMPEINPELKRAPIWAYAQLLKASARAIRAADPEAKIVAGSGFSDGQFLQRLYELDAKDDFDIASVHYLNCKHPDDFGRGYRRQREVMAAHGDAGKPLWDTENGPGGAVIGQAVRTPDEYTALYNIYRHCFAHQFGLERYFWFNPVGSSHGASTHTAAGRLAPAYQAMQTLTDFVGEGALLDHAHPGNETHVYVFDGPQGPVSVLWSTAPATARLAGGAAEATTYLGATQLLRDAFPLSGRPLFLPGNILPALDVTVVGPRETVVPSMKTVPAETPSFTCPVVETAPGIHDARWETIPFVATRETVPVLPQHDHFCKVTSSVSADVQMAYTDTALVLRVKTYDDQVVERPTGVVQFSLRDSDPAVAEWGYFTNAYGLYNLYASDRGPLFLRYEHMYADEYPTGVVRDVDMAVETQPDGLLYWAAIPWSVLGPCRPDRHNPFLLQFTFNCADHILDVPPGDTPEEWSHNFADNFIVKPPALARWVEMG